MLRKIRLAAALLFFTMITLLFLDFTGTVHGWFGWMAKIQFLPAVLALNVGVVIALVLLTLLLGRVYCSVICPLGVFQDIISWVSGKVKKNRFRYSPALSWLRYGVLAVFVVALVAGAVSLAALIAPYSAYGRIVSNLLTPLYQWGNNVLALWAERVDSYAFYSVDVWMKGLSTFANGCGLCARNCKSSCINPKAHEIDYSRCVACMDCLGKCRQGAIKYVSGQMLLKKQAPASEGIGKQVSQASLNKEKVDTARRGFFTVSALIAASVAVKAQEKKVDGGLAPLIDKKVPKRATPIVPAGALSFRHFAQHCTACQLCVSVCPNQVLRPSGDLKHLMQPEMSYERGYCRPECAKCAEVCPTDAIHLADLTEKSSVQIGHAVWVAQNCIVNTDGVSCGNCARHCPTGAILMVPKDADDGKSLKIPVVNTERCIGCGACENLCPSRPFSAIYVEGHEMHRII